MRFTLNKKAYAFFALLALIISGCASSNILNNTNDGIVLDTVKSTKV